MLRIFRTLTVAGTFLVAGAGLASAAVVQNDLNLRSGPGTGYRVIGVMPAGSYARVLSCGGSWCRVAYGGQIGYASASYLGGGAAYAAAPPPVYVEPVPRAVVVDPAPVRERTCVRDAYGNRTCTEVVR